MDSISTSVIPTVVTGIVTIHTLTYLRLERPRPLSCPWPTYGQTMMPLHHTHLMD